MEHKRADLENYLKRFFDEFSQTNALVFQDLKKSIQENERNMLMHMDAFKNTAVKYFNESPPEKNRQLIKSEHDIKQAKLSQMPNIKPISFTKKQFDELNETTKGFIALQMEKSLKINNLLNEVNKLN